ncbi:MAG: hypothetical protein AMJ78_08440 [Omnitrophica WOR_2 bacterium SM23_29]|nr:MAG: hypothetical protein AMJ78_08440 [Omnitrophica WOR_2 bacterium SM23_29]
MEKKPPIKIYNSMTKRLEEFKSITPGEVKMYVCGVTVYDECHIGHARSAFIFDVIRRYFKYCGYEVKFVKNITDVDDKIIDKAREELSVSNSPLKGFDLNDAVKQIAERYTRRFYEDMEALDIDKADTEPKATEHIPDMVKMIEALIKNGYAYKSDGDVYFEVRKYDKYGQLSHQNLDQMMEGARVEVGEKKKDPLDFALWKAAKEEEPEWSSPWGKGRPGWHIECSVMATKYLKENFDIHGGGRDLIFPHHENEIAQSECATGKPFANYWIHNGLLTIDGQKMSKSLGNFVSIKDVLSRYSSDVLKLFFLGTHYSNPIDFSWDRMEAAKNAYERFAILFNKIDREMGTGGYISTNGADTSNMDIFRLKERFEAAMNDNFNTPLALGALFDLVSVCNKVLDEKPKMYREMLKFGMDTLGELGGVLGLTFKDISKEVSDSEIETAIALREKLRKDRKFEEADKIRQKLSKKGIILEDEKDGTHWRRKG